MRVDGLAADAAVTVVYAVDGTQSKISAFTVNSGTGALTVVANSPFNTGAGPLSVAVNPTNNLLFTANQAANNVSSFKIQSGGGLTEQTSAGSPFSVSPSTSPVWVAPDPSGNFLYPCHAVHR